MAANEFRKLGGYTQSKIWNNDPDAFAEAYAEQELEWYIDISKKYLDENKALKQEQHQLAAALELALEALEDAHVMGAFQMILKRLKRC